MRRLAVHDFADASDAGLIQMRSKTFKQCQGVSGVAVYPVMRQGIGTEEPRPDGALVIAGIALAGVARVTVRVARVGGRKAPQANRGQKLPCAHIDDRPRALCIEKTGAERHGEDLIGPEARVYTLASAVDQVARAV